MFTELLHWTHCDNSCRMRIAETHTILLRYIWRYGNSSFRDIDGNGHITTQSKSPETRKFGDITNRSFGQPRSLRKGQWRIHPRQWQGWVGFDYFFSLSIGDSRLSWIKNPSGRVSDPQDAPRPWRGLDAPCHPLTIMSRTNVLHRGGQKSPFSHALKRCFWTIASLSYFIGRFRHCKPLQTCLVTVPTMECRVPRGSLWLVTLRMHEKRPYSQLSGDIWRDLIGRKWHLENFHWSQ